HPPRVPPLVDVLAALVDRDREAAELAHVQRPAVPGDRRLWEAVELAVGELGGVGQRVGDPAQAGAEHDPQARGEVLEAPHGGRNSGPNERGSRASSVVVWRAPLDAQTWISAPGTMNSRSRCR